MRCVGCRRLFSNQAAFNEHMVFKHSEGAWREGSIGHCGSDQDLSSRPLKKVGGVWFKTGKDL